MQNFSMQHSNSSITTRRYLITGSQRLSNFFWASLIFLGGAGFLLTGFSSFLNRGSFSVDLEEVKLLNTVDFVEQNVPAFRIQEQGFFFLQQQNIHEMGLQSKSSRLYAHITPLVNTTYDKERSNVSILTFFPFRFDLQSGKDQSGSNNSIKFFPQGLIMCFYGCSALIFSLYLWLTILWKVGNGFNEFNKKTGVVRIFRWGLPGKNRQIDFSYSLKDIEALRVTLKEGINPRRTIALQIKGKGEIPLTRIGEPMALQDIENQASELANFLKIEIQVLAA